MNVEFRQRSTGEFLKMLKRRKWVILLPMLTLTAAVGYVVYKLPSIYESKTVLTVKAPTISSNVVGSLYESTISQRIEMINTEVTSRHSLEPMIAKFDLFKMEKKAGVPTEIIIDSMRDNIKVEWNKTDENQLASIMISYRDRSPEAARGVTELLASKYVSSQVSIATDIAEDTQEFIDDALAEKKAALDTLEKQRLNIMSQNIDTIPEASQGLVAQLEGLRQREEGIGKEKETLQIEKGRINDRISELNRRISLVEKYGIEDAQKAREQASDVTNSLPYVSLIKERAAKRAELANLKLTLTDKNPKVIKVQNEIEEIDSEIEKLKSNVARRADTISDATVTSAQRDKQSLLTTKQKAESQIETYDAQIHQKAAELQQIGAQIAAVESKINQIPGVKVALESIETQYQTAKKAYDDLQEKKNSAQLQVNRESNAQGETIKVIDPANLPKSPVAPKREVLTLLGSGFGLVVGLFLTALFEVPRLFKIQNIEDAKHYTGLPLLAAVPPLLTQDEILWNKRSYWLKVLAGIVAAIGSIPVIIMILQEVGVFKSVIT